MKKKVLVIGPFSPGQLPGSFADALDHLGWEVFRFDSDRAYFDALPRSGNRLIRRARRRQSWNRLNVILREIVRAVRPALVLTVKGTFLNGETVRGVRKESGVRFVNYYADNPYCGVSLNPRKPSAQRSDLVDVLREYDRVWIWERGLASRLQKDGVLAGYLPFGIDPSFATSADAACEECSAPHEVVFIGQHSDKREDHIAAIRRHSVSLWGGRWPRARRRFEDRHVIHAKPAFAKRCAGLYRSAICALNVVDDLNMPGHNMRTWEVPASGGVLLSTFTREQAEFFPEGEAALYYRHPREIDALIDRLKSDPTMGEKIRANAARIVPEHTYEARVRTLLEELQT
jgi:spore maturation protein CgeB